MKFIFRADASPSIGAGHVMRCASIAEEAIARGIECLLMGSVENLDWVREYLSRLHIEIIDEQKFDYSAFGDSCALIIDSYDSDVHNYFAFDDNWSSKTHLVDQATPLSTADLFIHTGFDASWFEGEKTRLLSGSEFIPLRKDMASRSSHVNFLECSKIVIFAGGSDVYNLSLALAKTLHKFSNFKSAIFISNYEAAIKELDDRFQVYPFGELLNLALEDADLVLTTSSTSSLEMMARGIPIGIACAVSNQQGLYETLAKKSAAVQIGSRLELGEWDILQEEVSRLISSPRLRQDLAENSLKLLDYQGSRRIVDAILKLEMN
jgi:spore coat polysaccharide biosynthesis predicted glycosyltransferase SpsG